MTNVKPLAFKKLFKVASKSKIKPELTSLFLKKGYVYATDSFKAIKLKTTYDDDQEGYITKLSAAIAHEKSKDIEFPVLPELSKNDAKYPDIDKVIPTEFAIEVSVNRKYLIDLLEAMQAGDKFDKVTIKVQDKKGGAIVFEHENGLGLLMPLNA